MTHSAVTPERSAVKHGLHVSISAASILIALLLASPGFSVPVAFLHTTDAGNVVSNQSCMEHPLLNDRPDAVVHITRNLSPNGVAAGSHTHPLGLFYNVLTGRHCLINENGSAMAVGLAFNVLVTPPGSTYRFHAFRHTSDAGNTALLSTFLDDAFLNNETRRQVYATHRTNPSGPVPDFSPHFLGVEFLAAIQQWSVLNQDEANMDVGLAFDVLARNPRIGDGDNITLLINDGSAILFSSLVNPRDLFFVMPGFGHPLLPQAGGFNDHPVAVEYDGFRWSIVNADGANVPAGAAMHHWLAPLFGSGFETGDMSRWAP